MKSNEELITEALEHARRFRTSVIHVETNPLLREMADRIEHLSAELAKRDQAFSRLFMENGVLHERIRELNAGLAYAEGGAR